MKQDTEEILSKQINALGNEISDLKRSLSKEKGDYLLAVNDIAKIIQTNVSFVYKLINTGLLPALKLGRFKVRNSTLEKFLAKYEGYDLSDLNDIKCIFPGYISDEELLTTEMSRLKWYLNRCKRYDEYATFRGDDLVFLSNHIRQVPGDIIDDDIRAAAATGGHCTFELQPDMIDNLIELLLD